MEKSFWAFLLREDTCRPPASARGFGRIDTDKRNFKLTMR
jgi:hypothetical protein